MIISVLLAGCASAPSAALAQSEKPRVVSPDVEAADLTQLVAGNSAFAFDLYQAVRPGKDNLFYSPYSLSLALAMTYGGARGETERQMAEVLHFTLPQGRLHPAFNELDSDFAGRNSESFRLSIANAIWGEQDFDFVPVYLDMLAENYGAGLRLVDFVHEPENSRIRINDWVSDQTEGKIEDLMPEDSIDEFTRLVLTNAIYFKAKWEYRFSNGWTKDAPFNLLDGSQVNVPMMNQRANYRIAEGKGYVAVELPYEGNQMAMVVVLPNAGEFEEFESAFNTGRAEEVLRALQTHDVELTIPKFSFASAFSLADTLVGMGMPDAFDPSLGDFSGTHPWVSAADRLFLESVEHKAFVAVDEEGTEAAAASAVEVRVTSMPRLITIDRPFIFLIHDRETGAILFLGRLLDPST